ncbi:MAG: HAMP domain-containing sensor histidine kinase [Phycisphaerales bacterium]
MPKHLRISLASKCQLLFGAAVVLILTAALTVVAYRMQGLVERGPLQRAQDLAQWWLADEIQFGGKLNEIQRDATELPPDVNKAVSLIDHDRLERQAESDDFFARAVELFQTRPANELFEPALDSLGQTYYRYARAIRKSDLASVHGGAAGGFSPSVGNAALANPLEMVLLIHLRDDDASKQRTLNVITLVTAGLVSGLLAIGAFWFITTRIILSPVRLLHGYASKVSQGDMNIRSDINTGDEFQSLSDMFNTMLGNLKSNQDQLRSINKSLDLKLGELAESNVALYEANKIKGEFLANVSHELRTPLNSIIGFAEVLGEALAGRDDPKDEKRRRYAANIITSSRRLLDLINDLLDLAKIEAGRMEMRTGPVSIADTLEGLINLIKPLAEKQEIVVKQKVQPNLPKVFTDAGKLQQVLFNFLANAVKFTPPKGVVSVEAELVEKPDGGEPTHLRISVTDTGPGIHPDDQERIFEKFVQLDPGVTKEFGGTGLGLTISQELAELLQGKIELDSSPGRGATFSLTIPLILTEPTTPLMPEIVTSSNPRAPR